MKVYQIRLSLVIAVLLSGLLCLSLNGAAGQNASTGVNTARTPHQSIDTKAALVSANDSTSVGSLADEIFDFPRPYPRLPADIETNLKARLVKAELAFMNGSGVGVREADISSLVNSISQKLGAPEYAMTSPAQLRHLRMSLAIAEPKFMGKGLGHQEHIGDSVSPILSPLQALHLVLSLFDQKLINPDFQLPPGEWESKHASQEAGIAGKSGIARRTNSRRAELDTILRRDISSMGPSDTQQIINQSLAALGIH